MFVSCLCFSFSQTNPSEYLKSSMSSSSAYKHISVFFLWFSFFHKSIWLCYELSISVCHLMLHKSTFLCFSFSCTKASGYVMSRLMNGNRWGGSALPQRTCNGEHALHRISFVSHNMLSYIQTLKRVTKSVYIYRVVSLTAPP